jgi:hypothetical protein
MAYGSRGVPAVFAAIPDFVHQLDGCFAELWACCSIGKAEVVASAGAFVRKPGFHGLGRAFDLDAIFWHDRSFIALRDGFQCGNRRLYHGIECVLRRHFGQVLNCDYDTAHQDHFHVDDSQPVGCRPDSRAVTLFVQAVLTHIHQERVIVDGVWREETSSTLRQLLTARGCSGDFLDATIWRQFLADSASIAFGSFN